MFLNRTNTTQFWLSWICALGVAVFLSACNNGGGTSQPVVTPAITAFSINGTNAIITGDKILIQLPPETDVTHLVASFTSNIDDVAVNGAHQVSGITMNDFTKKLTYTLGGSKKQTNLATPTTNVTAYSVAVNYGILSNNVVSNNIQYSCNGYTGDVYVYLTGATSLIGQEVSLANYTRVYEHLYEDGSSETITMDTRQVVTVGSDGTAQALAFAKNSASVSKEINNCSVLPETVNLSNEAFYAEGTADMYEYSAMSSIIPFSTPFIPTNIGI